MSLVPREQFVPDEQKPLAYIDRSVPLGEGRALSRSGRARPAADGARRRFAASVRSSSVPAPAIRRRVLTEMGIDDGRASNPRRRWPRTAAQNGIEIVEGAAAEGLRKGAPYDLILVDGAVEYIPEDLVGPAGRGRTARHGPLARPAASGRRIERAAPHRVGLGWRTIVDADVALLARVRTGASLYLLTACGAQRGDWK